jgi:hypothetical protein
MLNAIYPIVEGHGDVAAAPVLLRRFAHESFQNFGVTIFPAHRVPKGQMLSPAEQFLERAAELGARKIAAVGGMGAILVLLDADEDCPANIGPALLRRVRAARPDIFSAVVVAKTEYEAWFLASATSLRGRCGVRTTAVTPQNPENIRDAKGYIERELLEPHRYYSERVDQPAMSAVIAFAEAATCPSFQKLQRDLAAVFAL